MSKPVFNEDQRKLFGLLSIKEAFDDIKRLFDVGERTVGTPGEYKAVKIIESRFNEIGLKNVHLEPFGVMTDYHEFAEIDLLEPISKKIACGRCFGTIEQSFATNPEGNTGFIVDVGHGRRIHS
jgi:hypothetical protein